MPFLHGKLNNTYIVVTFYKLEFTVFRNVRHITCISCHVVVSPRNLVMVIFLIRSMHNDFPALMKIFASDRPDM